MSKRDKLRRKLRKNPRGVKFSELETLLGRFGFTLVRVAGSHHIFRYGSGSGNPKFVIPVHGNNIKPEYVTDVIETLDTLFPEIEDDAESEDED